MTQEAVQAISERSTMFKGGFSTFSVNDVAKAKEFYGQVLGLNVTDEMEGLSVGVPNGPTLFIYPKDDHKPANFTVFNLQVDDVEHSAGELASRGIEFLQYDEPIKTDANGIFWGGKEGKGPNIAWFNDPAGNILSLIEE